MVNHSNHTSSAKTGEGSQEVGNTSSQGGPSIHANKNVRTARSQRCKIFHQKSSTFNFALVTLQYHTEDANIIWNDEKTGEKYTMAKRQTRYQSQFPKWLLARGMSWEFSTVYWNWNLNFSPWGDWNVKLRAFRYVSSDSEIVQLCRAGNVKDVQRMFESGRASPFDRVRFDDTLGDASLSHLRMYSISDVGDASLLHVRPRPFPFGKPKLRPNLVRGFESPRPTL